MAVLPESNTLNLPGGVEFSQPGLTWKINQETRRIEGTVDGYESVRQAVEIILYVERFRWQIYTPYSGVQFDGLIGQNPGYVGSELQRRITDALVMDDRVTGIKDFTYTADGDKMTVSFTVTTVYGDISAQTEVTLSD